MTLSPWPRSGPLTPATNTWTPTYEQWLSRLVMAVNGSPAVPFAGLPAAPTVGEMALVNDASTNVWGAVIAGGGANLVLAFWNGSFWTVAAK